MKETIVSFKVAKLAKEKGFENKTPHKLRRVYYNHLGEVNGDVTKYIKAFVNKEDTTKYTTVDAPTQSLLQKWLRDKHNIDVVTSPERYIDGINYLVQAQKWDLNSDPETNVNFVIQSSYWFNDNGEYPTYEEALEKGLQEALILITN